MMAFKKELRYHAFKTMEARLASHSAHADESALRIVLTKAFPTFPLYIIDEFLAQRKTP